MEWKGNNYVYGELGGRGRGAGASGNGGADHNVTVNPRPWTGDARTRCADPRHRSDQVTYGPPLAPPLPPRAGGYSQGSGRPGVTYQGYNSQGRSELPAPSTLRHNWQPAAPIIASICPPFPPPLPSPKPKPPAGSKPPQRPGARARGARPRRPAPADSRLSSPNPPAGNFYQNRDDGSYRYSNQHLPLQERRRQPLPRLWGGQGRDLRGPRRYQVRVQAAEEVRNEKVTAPRSKPKPKRAPQRPRPARARGAPAGCVWRAGGAARPGRFCRPGGVRQRLWPLARHTASPGWLDGRVVPIGSRRSRAIGAPARSKDGGCLLRPVPVAWPFSLPAVTRCLLNCTASRLRGGARLLKNTRGPARRRS